MITHRCENSLKRKLSIRFESGRWILRKPIFDIEWDNYFCEIISEINY